jgi:hypothetical protein
MKSRHHVAVQMEEEQQWQKDNGPIVLTADQLWKHSGEDSEKNNPGYTGYLVAQAINSKASRLPIKSRKEYFKIYQIKRRENEKINKITKKNKINA